MKRFIHTILLAACTIAALSSCDKIDQSEYDGTAYGFWVVESLAVDIETTVNGVTTTNTSITDYSKDYCRLMLDDSNIGYLWYNFDFDMETFVYDQGGSRITFRESLNAGDNGKAIVLLGVYSVELDGDVMTLHQKDINVGTDALGAKQSATYTLRRASKSEKPRETVSD